MEDTLLSGMAATSWIITCCGGIIGLALLAFTIWMIVDVVGRDESVLPKKTLWMLLMIVGIPLSFGWIVALVYYFTRKKKMDAMGGSAE